MHNVYNQIHTLLKYCIYYVPQRANNAPISNHRLANYWLIICYTHLSLITVYTHTHTHTYTHTHTHTNRQLSDGFYRWHLYPAERNITGDYYHNGNDGGEDNRVRGQGRCVPVCACLCLCVSLCMR